MDTIYHFWKNHLNMNLSIPSVDLSDFHTPAKKEQFIQSLGKAFNEIGFVAVKNHYLNDSIVEELYNSSIKFFELPDSVKAKYDIPGLAGQRGYTGKGKEHAKGRNTGDLKEFFHIGQELEENLKHLQKYPENIWPAEVPELANVGKLAYKKLEETGRDLLKAIAAYLNLPETYFEEKVEHGNSILRAIHYYPISDPDAVPADAVRAAEHEDINLITLLMGASADGLEIKTKKGNWVAVTALPEQIVVNVGDMLARLTNNKLRSTTHRVVNPPRDKMRSSRYSIPFFLHPKPDMDLSCLSSCVDQNHPKMYEDITAGAYLEERLIELGLLKK